MNAMEPRQFQPTEQVTVTLEAQQWNTVIGALAEAPYRIAAPLIERIAMQARRKPTPVEETFDAPAEE